jgi:[ribosomal protein S5]-alanine N-acetyltransferase
LNIASMNFEGEESLQPIVTERLVIRQLRIEDSLFIFRLVNSEGWLANIGDRNVPSERAAVVYINNILANPNIIYWVIESQDGQTPMGIVTLLKRDYLEHWDLGFAFLPDFNGQGYAFEASNAILTLLSARKYDKVMAITIPENQSSVRLLLKLGFIYEKELSRGNESLSLYSKPLISQSIGHV